MSTLTEVVFASSNANKCSEVKSMFSGYKVKVYSSADFNLQDIEETGSTFYENALLKAKFACLKTGMPALADDSGLCIKALPNILGVHTARFAGENRDYKRAINKIQTLLENETSKEAYFACNLVVYLPNGSIKSFEGIVEGEIVFHSKDLDGFGYDPIFRPKGYSEVFASMNKDIKNKISHRGKAFKLFAEECLQKI